MTNNEVVNKDNDSRKIFTMIIMVLTLMICTTSATYAYFALSATNNTISGTAATANLTLTVTQATLKTTNSSVMVPQLETALGTAMNSTNQCVDGNGNIICKVYTVTVTNGSTAAVRVYGTIQFSVTGTGAAMSNLKWKRVTGVNTLGTSTGGSYDGVAVGSINPTTASTIFDLTSGGECNNTTGGVTTGCTPVSLAKSNGTATYYLIVWINETNDVQTDSGTWRATINFESDNGKGITSTITG